MTTWCFWTPLYPDGSRDVLLELNSDDAAGNLQGGLTFMGDKFAVTGTWAAAGSEADRNFNALALRSADLASGTVFIAATGTFAGMADGSQQMQLNTLRVSTRNDRQYGWDGTLYSNGTTPNDPEG